MSTETSQPGDTFRANLSEAVVVDGQTVIPENAPATGQVVAVDEGGRVSGRARIELVMTAVEVAGRSVAIDTAPFAAEADPSRGQDAATIGGGAGVGAAIGGILGGGRGAAIGGAIGAGGGTAVVLATAGDALELPSETHIVFSLTETVRITGDAG